MAVLLSFNPPRLYHQMAGRGGGPPFNFYELRDNLDSVGQIAETSFTFTVSDPLTYTMSVDSGVVAQDPSDPAAFVWSP